MSITDNICDYIKRHNSTKSDEEMAVIKYGFDALFMNIDKFIIFILIGLIFHVLLYMIIAIAAYGSLRLFAFGVHARNKIECFIISFCIFIPNIFISINFQIDLYIRTVLFIISFIIILKYAPADTEDRPLPNKKTRKKFKLLSVIYVAFVYFLSITVYKKSPIGSIILISIISESLLITPFIYKILKRRYSNYETYTND